MSTAELSTFPTHCFISPHEVITENENGFSNDLGEHIRAKWKTSPQSDAELLIAISAFRNLQETTSVSWRLIRCRKQIEERHY